MSLYCSRCGKPVQPGSKFCDSCGQPLSQTAAPQPPVRPGQSGAAPASSRNFWITCAVLLGLLICGVIAAFAVYLTTAPRTNNSPVQPTAKQTAVPAITKRTPATPTKTVSALPSVQPTKQSTQAPTERPTQPPAATFTSIPEQGKSNPSENTVITTRVLDFTDFWNLAGNDEYQTDITQQGSWVISVFKPNLNVAALTPQQISATNINISVTVRSSVAGQIGGVICQYQNENNYYQVLLKDKSYAIGKVLNGKLYPLTDPYWQPSQFINAQGLTGGAAISVTCVGSMIGLTIEGMGELPLLPDPDNSFTSGKAGLVAESGTNAQQGSYSEISFNSFSVEAIP